MSQWTIRAEASGVLTLPVGTPWIDVDAVRISLRSANDASAKPYMVPVAMKGAALLGSPRRVPIPLVAIVTIEADSHTSAELQGRRVVDQALSLVSLVSGAAIQPAIVTGISRSITPEQVRFSGRARLVQGDVVVWGNNCEELLQPVSHALRQLSSKDQEHFGTALHWYGKAALQTEADTMFLFLWFSIEALASMSFVRYPTKDATCVKCGRTLKCDCGEPQQRSTVHVQDLLVHTTGLWSRKEYKERYRLRSKVVHGNISITEDELSQIERDIRPLHDTVHKLMQSILLDAFHNDSETTGK